MLKRQEEEMIKLQAKMALRQSRLSLYPGDVVRASVLDMTRDPLREIALETAMTQRKLRVTLGLKLSLSGSSPSMAKMRIYSRRIPEFFIEAQSPESKLCSGVEVLMPS